MSHQVVRVKREAVAPCMTCPICRNPFREATTVIECLHTFCRKCIYKKLSDEEMECCPTCNIHLGCAPLEKLRPDNKLQDVAEKIFTYKRTKATGAEVTPPITLPAKRKDRSLSFGGSKSTARKTPRPSRFAIERHARRDDPVDALSEDSSSPETLKRFTQNRIQNSSGGGPYNHLSRDKRIDEHSEAGDDWKHLKCLVEAASRTKPSKLDILEAGDELEPRDNKGLVCKPKNRGTRQKQKDRDYTPESERPKTWKRHEKKAQNHGEFKAKSERRKCPIWFSLVSDEWEGVARPLPQIASSYIRIKDGSMPVSYLQKYLKMKLNLMSEDEVEIKCMGQSLIPTLPLNDIVDWWVQLMSTDKASVAVGSSAKEFVMVLGYGRKSPDS